jgi:hypothetical protein
MSGFYSHTTVWLEGRTALREGALLAKQCSAQAFLLSILADTGTLLLSEVALARATVRIEEDFQEILSEGVARLRSLGFDPVAELVRGQPAEEIGKFARQVAQISSSWVTADRVHLTVGGQVRRALT